MRTSETSTAAGGGTMRGLVVAAVWFALAFAATELLADGLSAWQAASRSSSDILLSRYQQVHP